MQWVHWRENSFPVERNPLAPFDPTCSHIIITESDIVRVQALHQDSIFSVITKCSHPTSPQFILLELPPIFKGNQSIKGHLCHPGWKGTKEEASYCPSYAAIIVTMKMKSKVHDQCKLGMQPTLQYHTSITTIANSSMTACNSWKQMTIKSPTTVSS